MKDIPIPQRMAKLDRDPRGYPIPVGVLRDDTGRPHFQINNEPLRQKHMSEELCPLCGEKLWRGRWFVGGPHAAFHPDGAYIDAPMHTECCRYALAVCPYLAAPNYSKRIDARTMNGKSGVLLVEEECRDARPVLFVAVMTTGQKAVRWDGGIMKGDIRYLRPRRPFSRVEYWQHGRQLDEAEAEVLLRRSDR